MHIIVIFLDLGYVTQYGFVYIHPFACKFQDVIIFLPLSVNVPHFLIHSLVEGHIGCYQVLVITNNAAISIVEHMSLWYD